MRRLVLRALLAVVAVTGSRGIAPTAANGKQRSESIPHGGRTFGKAGETSEHLSVPDARTAIHYEAEHEISDTVLILNRA